MRFSIYSIRKRRSQLRETNQTNDDDNVVKPIVYLKYGDADPRDPFPGMTHLFSSAGY